MRAFLHSLKSLLMSLTLLASALSLSACGGSGNTFGNGSGAPTSATAANQVAGIDIANGNYSAAISVLTPFCPNNNCQNADIANTLANAYMAMGNTSTGTSVTGTSSVTGASGAGATVTQILSNLLTLVNNGSTTTTNQIMQAIFQAVPCISNNNCTTTYLSNLATAVQILANTPCSGSTASADVATTCPDSSTIIVASMVYILAAAQYDTGIVYTNSSWEVCPASGGGTSGCSSGLSTITHQTISGTQLDNIAAILDNISVTSITGTNPTITINNATIVNVTPYFLASFGTSSNSSIVTPINEFLYSINCYNSSTSISCEPGNFSNQAASGPPTSISFSSQALTRLMATF